MSLNVPFFYILLAYIYPAYIISFYLKINTIFYIYFWSLKIVVSFSVLYLFLLFSFIRTLYGRVLSLFSQYVYGRTILFQIQKTKQNKETRRRLRFESTLCHPHSDLTQPLWCSFSTPLTSLLMVIIRAP